MATYSTETVTHTIRRWRVPAAEPWGAAAEEVSKAWAAASAAYRQAYNVPETHALPGDELVIEFKTETPSEAGCQLPHEMEA